MARSRNGNLLGKAARTELRDFWETIETSFAKDWHSSVDRIESLLGDDFAAWWDSYPETMSKREFLKIIKDKIGDVEASRVYGKNWEMDADALRNALENGNEQIELAEQRDWLSDGATVGDSASEDGCGNDDDLHYIGQMF